MTSRKTFAMRWIAVAVAGVLAAAGAASDASATTAGPSTAAGTTPPTASVEGSARVAYLPSPDDEVRFVVDADATFADPHSPFPTEVSGRVRVSHHVVTGPPEPVTVWAEVAVDCMMTGGPTATVTGIVVDASPEARDWMGVRLGFSIYDGGRRDRIGFSGPTPPGEPLLPKCMAPAAGFTIREGGYTVRDDLP